MGGTQQEKEFDGLSARVIQHEMEHLQGKRFTENVSKAVLAHSKGKVNGNLRRLKKSREAIQRQYNQARRESELNKNKTIQAGPIQLPNPVIEQKNSSSAPSGPFRIETPDIVLSD
jgi:hypothetical protein